MQALDVTCKQDRVPIVYDVNYNIETTQPQSLLSDQIMLLDKPAQVFSRIRGQSVKHLS